MSCYTILLYNVYRIIKTKQKCCLNKAYYKNKETTTFHFSCIRSQPVCLSQWLERSACTCYIPNSPKYHFPVTFSEIAFRFTSKFTHDLRT